MSQLLLRARHNKVPIRNAFARRKPSKPRRTCRSITVNIGNRAAGKLPGESVFNLLEQSAINWMTHQIKCGRMQQKSSPERKFVSSPDHARPNLSLRASQRLLAALAACSASFPSDQAQTGQFLPEHSLIAFISDAVQKANWSKPESDGHPRRLRTSKHEAIAVVLTYAYARGTYSSREIEELSAGNEQGLEWLSRFALTSQDFQRFRRWNPNFLTGCLARVILGLWHLGSASSSINVPRWASVHFTSTPYVGAIEDEAAIEDLADTEARRRLLEAVKRDSFENDD